MMCNVRIINPEVTNLGLLVHSDLEYNYAQIGCTKNSYLNL